MSLSNLARITQNESYFYKAFNEYEKSLKINPNNESNLKNYASSLLKLALIKEEEDLFERAIKQYEKVLEINKDTGNIYSNYGTALTGLAQLKGNQNLFQKGLEAHLQALILEPTETYNIACYYSVVGNFEQCKENLFFAHQNNTLPPEPYKYLNEDVDLNNVRQESWFIDFLASLKDQQETSEKAS